MNRTKKSIINIGTSVFVNVVKSLLLFVTRTIFIWKLGKEMLGLNGLFTNVLSMLSLAELGLSSAINFSLYKPLVENDNKKISALMSFYKRTYSTIGFIVFILGIAFIPFLGVFIKDINNYDSIYLIYFLFLLNTSTSYFISYKETLIVADQKKYLLTKIETISIILLNLFQILSLVLTSNYIIYLMVQLIVLTFQRIVTNIYIKNKYKDINFNSKDKIETEDLNIIKKNVKAMFFHKIGDYCINGTDNIVLSYIIDLAIVGIYSNYLVIISLLNSFIALIFNSVTSSLGNFIVLNNDKEKEKVFNRMEFISFVIHGLSFLLLINIFNSFIKMWIGDEYLLEYVSVVIISANFYIRGMRIPSTTMKQAAGVFNEDKFDPLIQSVFNLVISIVFGKLYGINGVLIGTLASSLIMPSWHRPYIVYKYILHTNCSKYYFEYIKRVALLTIMSLITGIIGSYIQFNSIMVSIILNGLVISIVFVIFIITLYRKSDEYNYALELTKKIIGGKNV